MNRDRLILALLLAATFAVRAVHPDQPIVENYVGRQIPTAMVARNLERGSGFLRPQLDTGPWPNLFLVEPPIYAQLVASIRPILGFELEPTGRLVSAAATTLAAWGLFGLARRREGSGVALLALASFGIFPVMIRYGRAFQPDALMLGCVLAGLRGWDEFEATGDRRWLGFGGFVLAAGLALKITSAWALLPFFLIVRRWRPARRIAMATAMLLPAFAWYLHAGKELAGPGTGSLASSGNAAIWLRALSPEGLLKGATWANLGLGLIVRAFTPVGFVLAAWGLIAPGKVDRLWLGWGVACAGAVLALATKWHHAYYWMAVAPLVAVGFARGMACLGRLRAWGRPAVVGLGSCFVILCVCQSASTWRTPVEWADLREAARLVASLTTEDEPVVAPEALLYYSGRSGFRLEFDRDASSRAAGEWGMSLPDFPGPIALTELYWTIYTLESMNVRWTSQNANFHVSAAASLLVADVGLEATDGGRRAWRAAIRGRPDTRIIADRPGMMIAELH